MQAPELPPTVPQAPDFLSGPISLLLTNADDFSAKVTVTLPSEPTPLSGNLFQQEGMLLFIPTAESVTPRRNPSASVRYLWDVAGRKGYMISEALHGYVLVLAKGAYPQITMQGQAERTEVNGLACSVGEFTIAGANPADDSFKVWSADELKGVSLKIHSRSGGMLQHSDVNLDRLTSELFVLPVDFVEFDSPAAMMREIVRKPRVMPYSYDHGRRSR